MLSHDASIKKGYLQSFVASSAQRHPTSSLPYAATMASSANFNASSSLRILEPELYKQRVKDMFQARAPTYDMQNTFHPKIVGMVLKACSFSSPLFRHRLCHIVDRQ